MVDELKQLDIPLPMDVVHSFFVFCAVRGMDPGDALSEAVSEWVGVAEKMEVR